MEETRVKKWARPKPPKQPIQCPWCDHRPMPAGKLAQHVANRHPLTWKGNIYATLPADFDYGNGPLSAHDREMLILYGQYAKNSYKRNRRKEPAVKRRSYVRKPKATPAEPPSPNGLIPRFDRAVKFCPHCGWNLDACAKAQAFVDGRAS